MVMDKVALETKLANLQSRFDALNEEKQQHNQRSSEIEAELFRMQGDFRTIKQLISEAQVAPEDQTPISEANIIEAKPKEEEKDATEPTS
jgi:hypothetical protein